MQCLFPIIKDKCLNFNANTNLNAVDVICQIDTVYKEVLNNGPDIFNGFFQRISWAKLQKSVKWNLLSKL